jgi:hypothetical protein
VEIFSLPSVCALSSQHTHNSRREREREREERRVFLFLKRKEGKEERIIEL